MKNIKAGQSAVVAGELPDNNFRGTQKDFRKRLTQLCNQRGWRTDWRKRRTPPTP